MTVALNVWIGARKEGSMAEAWKTDFHIAVGNKDAAAMRRSVAAGLPVNELVLGHQRTYTPCSTPSTKAADPRSSTC